MSCRKLRFHEYLGRHAPAALLCLGLGAVGCAGGGFNLSSRLSRGEQIAAETQHESEQHASSQKDAGSIARLLRLPRQKPAAEADPQDEPRNGRVFSALVDRRPQSADSTTDPFLAGEADTQRETSPQPPTSRNVARVTQHRAAADENTDPQSQRPLSDDELWKMLEAESGSAPVPSPAQVAADSPVAAAETPVWARSSSTPAPAAARQNDYQTPAFAAAPADDSADRTMLPPTSETAQAESSDDERRQQVEDLLAEARRQEARNALQEAYHAAALAERIASREHLVFAPQEEQPADVARRLVQRMQTAPQHDPFGEIAIKPLDVTEASLAQESAAPQFPGAAEQPHGSPAVAARDGNRQPVPTPREPPVGVEDAFPPAQEWRGVKANTPVSLAVVEAEPTPFQRNPDPVQHAVLKAPGATGTLPHRLDAGSEPLWATRPDERLSWPGSEFGGPALVREPEPAPTSVAPPPPLDVSAERRLSAGTREQPAPEAARQTSGMTWWILGAVAMLAAAVLVRIRRGRTAAL